MLRQPQLLSLNEGAAPFVAPRCRDPWDSRVFAKGRLF